MAISKLDEVRVNDLIQAEFFEKDGNTYLRIRPINPNVYFRTHSDVVLTLRELSRITDIIPGA